MPRFYMLNGYRSRDGVTAHNPQIFCEIHQQLEDVDWETYIKFCKDDAEAGRIGMKATYHCGEEK